MFSSYDGSDDNHYPCVLPNVTQCPNGEMMASPRHPSNAADGISLPSISPHVHSSVSLASDKHGCTLVWGHQWFWCIPLSGIVHRLFTFLAYQLTVTHMIQPEVLLCNGRVSCWSMLIGAPELADEYPHQQHCDIFSCMFVYFLSKCSHLQWLCTSCAFPTLQDMSSDSSVWSLTTCNWRLHVSWYSC